MMNHEPKCIQWKRRGAEKIAELTANMSREQELEFWHKKTEQLRVRQEEFREQMLNSNKSLQFSQEPVYRWPNDGLQLTAGKKPPAATEAGR